ncbi:SPARC-related modular calcium-binding protein 2-like isoform X4 [Littorina saxatilis]|uniref:SPARC-related modular calcium-binding protein 2-like isoform X4 n=1 Tax=Littorina saxatilis TaxID=31220 RepID=UPI0038B42EFE
MANRPRIYASSTATTTTISITTATTRVFWMSLTLLLMLMASLVSPVTAQDQSAGVDGHTMPSGHSAGGLKLSQVDGKSLFRSLRASSCSVDCSTAVVDYVCGTDGVTYTSRCELKRAKECDGKRADGSRVKVRHKGSCPGDTTVSSRCFEERQEARKTARKASSDVLIPSCNPDGTFSEVQCHKTTGYCWCVTKDGRHIPGTSVQERRPRCKGKRRRRKGRNSKKKKKRKACTSKERQSFNTDLVRVFREEYERMLTARGPEAVNDEAPSDDDVSIEKKIVVWKFAQLDSNDDGMLSFKEIRSFRRMVKKLIKPRRCAKRFHRYCDKDHDRRIEKKEWTLCLGVDIKHGLTTDSPVDKQGDDPIIRPLPPVPRPPSGSLPPLSSRSVTPFTARKNRTVPSLLVSLISRLPLPPLDSGKKSCLEERQAAMLHSREEPTANIYIPRCQDNGLWSQAQCHEATQYCWCVSEDSGIPIPGIATYRVEPNCTIRDDRQIKGFSFSGCPFEQKRRFIVDLMADLTQEMNAANTSAQPLSGETSSREIVAKWKLSSLDKNRNGMLEKQEWRDLRKTLKKNKNYPRKCRRQFLRYCDENNDKTLSMEEWRECLGLNHNLFNSLPRDPKRRGKKNPFLDQLT